MITVNWSRYLQQSDSLVVAREAIFEAMFERAAGQLELEVESERNRDFLDLYVPDLNLDRATQPLDLLEQVNLLAHITVDVSSNEEQDLLSAYALKTTIEFVPDFP